MFPQDWEYLHIQLELLIVIGGSGIAQISQIQLGDINRQPGCSKSVEIASHRSCVGGFELKAMPLHTNAVDEPSVLQQVDDLEVGRCGEIVINNAKIVDQQLGVGQVCARQRERPYYPVPACRTVAPKSILVARTCRRSATIGWIVPVKRFVDNRNGQVLGCKSGYRLP